MRLSSARMAVRRSQVTTCDENGTHTAQFVTPTDHRHWLTAPPAPGRIRVHLSEVEVEVGIALLDRDAA
jgi:hypothetical protein